jgi:hypothetical protein
VMLPFCFDFFISGSTVTQRRAAFQAACLLVDCRRFHQAASSGLFQLNRT